MSVTITIEGNYNHCCENGLGRPARFECPCASRLLGQEPDPQCPKCEGRGEFISIELPYVMAFDEETFEVLWATLELKATDTGWMDGRSLRRALAKCSVEAVQERAQELRAVPGISVDRVENYIASLSVLCDEGEKRESRIVWF